MDLFALRGLERLAAVAIGGMAIYLGYRLFQSIPQGGEGEARISLPGDVSIMISRVGPGVFFALFGTLVVAGSLYYAIKYGRRSWAGCPCAEQACLQASCWRLDGRSGPALAQKWGACFLGRDHAGRPAQVALQVERYGDWFEIFGRIASPTVGQLRFKADGHSGAGRLFSGHEHESDALYINVLDLNETAFVLEVEGYGVFQFERSGC